MQKSGGVQDPALHVAGDKSPRYFSAEIPHPRRNIRYNGSGRQSCFGFVLPAGGLGFWYCLCENERSFTLVGMFVKTVQDDFLRKSFGAWNFYIFVAGDKTPPYIATSPLSIFPTQRQKRRFENQYCIF